MRALMDAFSGMPTSGAIARAATRACFEGTPLRVGLGLYLEHVLP